MWKEMPDLRFCCLSIGLCPPSWAPGHLEDFFQPLEFPRLELLLAYTELSFARLDLEPGAKLFSKLEHFESEVEGEDDSG